MQRMIYPFLMLMMLVSLTGCGGSSVDLPEKVFSDDIYAVQWIDFSKMKPEDGVKMVNGLADDMPDDQPKARLWMSAMADMLESSYQERWETFSEAGGQGMLVIHQAKSKTTGEGDNATTTVDRRAFILVKVKKGTSTDALEKALADFAKDDGNEKIKFETIEGTETWFWMTREGRAEDAPKPPTDGNAENAKKFKALLAKADSAPVVSAWRTISALTDTIKKEMEREGITEEQKQRLKEAMGTESVVMAVTPGSSPKVSVSIEFTDKELAASFAEEHNSGLVESRRAMKIDLVNTENPPHPSVVNRIVENLQITPSGKRVVIKLDSSAIEDGLNVLAATQGQGRISVVNPASLLAIHSDLNVPAVPGPPQCYRIRFSDR